MKVRLITLILVALSWQLASACQVPVFRYALENWEPDRLTVAVLYSAEDGQQQQTDALVETLESAAGAADAKVNLSVHRIDVSAEHPQGSPEAYYAEKWQDAELPHMLVFFANYGPEPHLAWSGSLDQKTVQELIASEQRRQLVERLLDGQTAVWVLLKSGNPAADDRAEKVLREELAKKPAEIELPSLTDLASEEQFNELLPVEMRVEFSVITIDPDDESEAFFREMLLNTERDLNEFSEEPIAIPIYGRGRTYFALVGAGINADNIADNCNFICGACSCEVKRDNPGQDLLLAANWNRVQPGNWVNDTPLPALTGIGGFEAMTEVAPDANHPAQEQTEVPVDQVNQPSVEAATVVAEETSFQGPPKVTRDEGRGDLTMLLIGWGGALFCLGLIFTLWRRSRITE